MTLSDGRGLGERAPTRAEHRGPCHDPHRHRNCPGLWRGEFTTGYTGDGKRTRRKVSGTTKAAVIDKLRDLHHQLDKGVTPKAGYARYGNRRRTVPAQGTWHAVRAPQAGRLGLERRNAPPVPGAASGRRPPT